MSDASPSPESRDDIAQSADGEALGAAPSVTALCKEAEPSAASLTEPTDKGGGTPTTASGSAADHMSMDPASILPMNLLAHIDRLKAEKKRLKDEKKALNKTLKNAEKRRARLKKKARQLSNKDLQDLLQLHLNLE